MTSIFGLCPNVNNASSTYYIVSTRFVLCPFGECCPSTSDVYIQRLYNINRYFPIVHVQSFYNPNSILYNINRKHEIQIVISWVVSDISVGDEGISLRAVLHLAVASWVPSKLNCSELQTSWIDPRNNIIPLCHHYKYQLWSRWFILTNQTSISTTETQML